MQKRDKRIIGCIADDFTGASDAASFLAKGGLATILYNGIPDKKAKIDNSRAFVIALKTRTVERDAAVKETLRAVRWLRAQGVDQLYIKYCSTFDSTPDGNIGPILDAVLEELQAEFTVLCPSLPVNGRIVKNGRLYVNGILLEESTMRDHPLTPMRDSRIQNLMEAQSQYPCLELGRDFKAAEGRVNSFRKGKRHFYVIPDFCCDEDAGEIIRIFGDLPVLSGGSGLLEPLARAYGGKLAAYTKIPVKGPVLMLAGSCSEATRKQISYAQKCGIRTMKVEPLKLLFGEQKLQDLWKFVCEEESSALIYSSDEPQAVREAQQAGKEKIAELLEQTMAELAKKAEEAGYVGVIVAGGETSGAVTKRLGYFAYQIVESVAPGVPIMIPCNNQKFRLILKSGNFGAENFFLYAQQLLL